MRPRRNTTFLTVPLPSSFLASADTDTTNDAEKQQFTLPPLSPLLPTTRLKVNKIEERSFYRRHALRVAVAITMVLFLCWQATNILMTVKNLQTPSSVAKIETQLTDLPKHASAIMVDDGSKWTVSIPHDSAFPLSADDHARICTSAETVRADLNAVSSSSLGGTWWPKSACTNLDRTYLDVAEAEAMGFLPSNDDEPPTENICEKSLTFVLESDNVSFGSSLLMLWLSYGLAQKQGRAFFLDDSRWAWSKYTSYFQPPPQPQCSRPPAHHIVPCPSTARHIVVSSSTAQWTLGAAFQKQYMQSSRFVRDQQTQVFALVRAGYDALFRLADEDAQYVDERVTRFRGEAQTTQASLIGLNIRRGDRHPFEFQYSHDYLPISRYIDAAYQILPTLVKQPASDFFSSITSFLSPSASPPPVVPSATLILASDDPDIHLSDELLLALSAHDIPSEGLTRAQDRILLAAKSALDAAAASKVRTISQPRRELHVPHDGHTAIQYHKHVAETAGWDGGFYAAMFASLGNSNDGAHVDAIQMRTLVGRAYVLDLAVLARSSDATVCAVSSAGCRILGVAMGWQGVISGRKWVNVDDGRGWSWDGNGP
jgi:hypothetical protein